MNEFFIFQQNFSSFGIDWEELPLPTDDCVLPDDVETSCAFSEMEIHNQFDPLSPCDDYGITLYLNAREFLHQLGH